VSKARMVVGFKVKAAEVQSAMWKTLHTCGAYRLTTASRGSVTLLILCPN